MEKISLWHKVKIALYLLIAFALMCGIAVYYGYTQRTLDGRRFAAYAIAFVLLFAIFVGMYLFLYREDRQSFLGSRTSLAFVSAIVLTVGLSLFVTETLSLYFRPLALAGLILAVVKNKTAGIFANAFACMTIIVIDMLFTPLPMNIIIFCNIFLGVLSSTLFVYFASDLKKRLTTIFMGFKMMVINAALAAVIHLILAQDITVLYAGLWGAGAAILSMLLFMGILPLYELVFNFITDFRLHELCDHNNKLLVELRENAPGTFNHSIVLANIAEMCALAIGENSNLARVCAYYHDIGKLTNTIYFKENQGEKNPHDDITPEVSVNIIKNHVTNGVKKADEYKLPNEIIDIIKEHHGTLPIKVFYFKALKYTDGSLETNTFSYDGPKPSSKISAIIMIADACEAAARAVGSSDRAAVEKVVAEIINERMRLNQFSNCDITFKELYVIKDVIVKTLSGVYHERVKYPDLQLGINEEKGNA